MSEAGKCPKALAAPFLGFERIADKPEAQRIMRESSRHEALVAEDLAEEGIVLSGGLLCGKCQDEFGDKRYGTHVEIKNASVRLIGHLDRQAHLSDKWIPVEIKAFGRFTFEKWRKMAWDYYSEYEAQEALYLHATHKSGLYVVKNRDTGELLKYYVPNTYDGGYYSPVGWERLDLRVKAADILSKFEMIESKVQEGMLPDAESSGLCDRCSYRYLCEKEPTKLVSVTPDLAQAVTLWKEGKIAEAEGEEKLAKAKGMFVAHMQGAGLDKCAVADLTVRYYGQRVNKYVDVKLLESMVTKEVMQKVTRQGKTWEDIRIS